MEALPLHLAAKTTKRYACSNCWGELEIVYNDFLPAGSVYVLCKRCQDETKGYVSQYFVNRRRGESEFEKVNVTQLLRTIGVLEKPNLGSRDDIMKRLGF